MRLYPPPGSWGARRHPVRDPGVHDPQRWNLLISQWVIHRDPRWFEAPDEFRPERWESEKTQRPSRCAFMPFGAGPRQCIGRHFAMMEAVIILASWLSGLSLSATARIPSSPSPGLHPAQRSCACHRQAPRAGKQCEETFNSNYIWRYAQLIV